MAPIGEFIDGALIGVGFIELLIGSLTPGTGQAMLIIGSLSYIVSKKDAIVDYFTQDYLDASWYDILNLKKLIREILTLLSIACALDKAKAYLSKHGLSRFPCPEDQAVLGNLISQNRNSLSRIEQIMEGVLGEPTRFF